jgi:hypothetical protein
MMPGVLGRFFMKIYEEKYFLKWHQPFVTRGSSRHDLAVNVLTLKCRVRATALVVGQCPQAATRALDKREQKEYILARRIALWAWPLSGAGSLFLADNPLFHR